MVTHQIVKLTDIRRRNKVRLDYVTHEQITDPFGILAVHFVSFLRFGVLGMSKNNIAGFFKNIEHENTILSG